MKLSNRLFRILDQYKIAMTQHFRAQQVALSPLPVSYTHLDVYKRQGLGRGRLAGAKQQDQGEQQGARQRRRKGELHLSFSRESSTGEQLSQRLRCWRVAVGGKAANN